MAASIERDGKVVGSSLIGQNFASDRYFHGRPSATSAPDPADSTKTIDAPYNAANSSGSNLGPTSQKLVDRVNGAIEAEFAAGRVDIVAADAVTTSASGLDPHISPQYALAQVPAVAKARNLSETRVRALSRPISSSVSPDSSVSRASMFSASTWSWTVCARRWSPKSGRPLERLP